MVASRPAFVRLNPFNRWSVSQYTGEGNREGQGFLSLEGGNWGQSTWYDRDKSDRRSHRRPLPPASAGNTARHLRKLFPSGQRKEPIPPNCAGSASEGC